MHDFFSAPQYWFARLLFERSLAVIYFIAFLSAFNQFTALLGENGLLPVPRYLKYVDFRRAPSLFHFHYSDRCLRITCLTGMFLSIAIALGGLSTAPFLLHMLVWLVLYVFYLSIVNVGQIFYGFGWESMLLEAGFFASFMGPEWMMPSWIPILIMRWMLFRTEFGAGMIKIRGDACWRDLTCLYYHHETQPLPNALSRYFHFSPKIVHRGGVVFSHFVQLVAPFGLFFPQPIAGIAGALLIAHQLILIISGNYSWLNWITIVMACLAFGGSHPHVAPIATEALVIQIGVGLFALVLSYQPLLNLISSNQMMNYCWNRWHLVSAYGAFGSVTKKRYEIVIEGTDDLNLNDQTVWKEYHFKGKPGDLKRRPPLVAPYHLRLDWLIWFLPFSVQVGHNRIGIRGYESWFLRFMQKLLLGEKDISKLLKLDPFPTHPPSYVRAKFYLYHFTNKQEMKETSNFWKRTFIDFYLPPIGREDIETN